MISVPGDCAVVSISGMSTSGLVSGVYSNYDPDQSGDSVPIHVDTAGYNLSSFVHQPGNPVKTAFCI